MNNLFSKFRVVKQIFIKKVLNEYVVLSKEFVHDHLNMEIVEIPYHKLVCSLSFFARTSDDLKYS